MGNTTSTPFEACLNTVCNGRGGCAGFPSDPFYQMDWVQPNNLNLPVVPLAVVRPDTAEDVSGFVKCAGRYGVKVQAKSGGHSYANYGLGGIDGELAIDLVNMQHFDMDRSTWQATIGGGTLLADVTQRLHDNGNRAIAHGTCPGVGIGGHATIGGLGPASRMWGSTLDHVIEVEVVTADGTIQRANTTHNSDLFFALKGAGAGFGVITEFVFKTHPEPGDVVEYTYSVTFGRIRDMAPLFHAWQHVISDPELDRRFASELIVHELGIIITATFYGTEDEFRATGIPDRIPASPTSAVFHDWLGAVAHQAEEAALWLSNAHVPFTAKALAFRPQDILSAATIVDLMNYIDGADRGTLLWFLIFDLSGGAVNDIPINATAYPHRDKLMFAQAYGVGIPRVSDATQKFLQGMFDTIDRGVSGNLSSYAGYVDPSLGAAAQEEYWGPNLPRLEQVKRAWDPADRFSNPQSVRPAADTAAPGTGSGTGTKTGTGDTVAPLASEGTANQLRIGSLLGEGVRMARQTCDRVLRKQGGGA